MRPRFELTSLLYNRGRSATLKRGRSATLNRGRREDRVRAAPAVSRAKAERKTHTSIQVQRKQSGLPCAMVLTVSFELSPATGFLATVATRKLPRNLTPASGRQYLSENILNQMNRL